MTSPERMRFNLMGTVFEVSRNTYNNLKELSDESKFMIKEGTTGDAKREVFLERDPACFAALVRFCQEGALHLPSSLCPQVFKTEMKRWGVELSRMENCCYNAMLSFLEDREVVDKFERGFTRHRTASEGPVTMTTWQTIRFRAWDIMDRPFSYRLGKVYFFTSLLFLVLSLFSMIVSTHDAFMRDMTQDEWKEALGRDYYEHEEYFQRKFPPWRAPSDEDDYEDYGNIDTSLHQANKRSVRETDEIFSYHPIPGTHNKGNEALGSEKHELDSEVDGIEPSAPEEHGKESLELQDDYGTSNTRTYDEGQRSKRAEDMGGRFESDEVSRNEFVSTGGSDANSDLPASSQNSGVRLFESKIDLGDVTKYKLFKEPPRHTDNKPNISPSKDNKSLIDREGNTARRQILAAATELQRTHENIVEPSRVKRNAQGPNLPESSRVKRNAQGPNPPESSRVERNAQGPNLPESSRVKRNAQGPNPPESSRVKRNAQGPNPPESSRVKRNAQGPNPPESSRVKRNAQGPNPPESSRVKRNAQGPNPPESSRVKRNAQGPNPPESSRVKRNAQGPNHPKSSRMKRNAQGPNPSAGGGAQPPITASQDTSQSTQPSDVSSDTGDSLSNASQTTQSSQPNISAGKPITPQTTESLAPSHYENLRARLSFLDYIDYMCLVFFALDFLLRLVFCPKLSRFFCSVLNLADLVALLAGLGKILVDLLLPEEKYSLSTLDLIDCMQIARFLRFVRLSRDVIGFKVLVHSVKASLYELLLLMMFLTSGVLVFSTLVFWCERDNMGSIPEAFWWAIVTMTTVGYGDIAPKSFLGKVVGSLCAVSGVVLIAITIPVLVNNFLLFYGYSKVIQARLREAKEKEVKQHWKDAAGCTQRTASTCSINRIHVKPLHGVPLGDGLHPEQAKVKF